MTCASCANRIERKLNKLDGVTATRELRHREGDASSSTPAASRPRSSSRAVEAAGYQAVLPAAEPAPAAGEPSATRLRRCAGG